MTPWKKKYELEEQTNSWKCDHTVLTLDLADASNITGTEAVARSSEADQDDQSDEEDWRLDCEHVSMHGCSVILGNKTT